MQLLPTLQLLVKTPTRARLQGTPERDFFNLSIFHMQNIVGQTPRGENFFPRPNVIKQIYRKLEGSHVYISAPRRVGKTAIMRYLEDNPQENYEFIYLITEAVYNPIEFFKRLLDTIKKFKNISQKSFEDITNFLKKISDVEIMGNKIGFVNEVDYLAEFKQIIKNLDTNGKIIVIMIDEFPQAVENILQDMGEAHAKRLLHANREIRLVANKNIRFIYTGSIGLSPLAEKLGVSDTINDLNYLELEPLTKKEATELCEEILNHAKVPFHLAAISHLLEIISWLIPFHIQLALQELIDEYDKNEQKININIANYAVSKITNVKNNQYFEQYHNHLKKVFQHPGKEYQLAKKILDFLSENESLNKQDIYDWSIGLEVSGNLNRIIGILEFDGYMYGDYTKTPTAFRFTSPIIQMWWRKTLI